jgi:predicted porin
MYGLITPGVAATDVKAWGVGGDWKMSTENKLNLSYYDAKDAGAIGGGTGVTKTLALLDTYALSKRTTLFVQLASIKVDTTAGLSNLMDIIYAPAGIAAPGGNTTAFGLGMNHSF